jgi:hypothetical protein
MILRTVLVLGFLFATPFQNSVDQIAASGRCVTLAEDPDGRLGTGPKIAPGQPPVLSFRFYEGKAHHRFGNSDLLLDDAGH